MKTAPTIELDSAMREKLSRTLKACAVTNLRKTTRVITQFYNEALRPVELSSTQYILLGNLILNDSLTINELADQLVMDRTTLTRDLKPLQKRGLVVVRAGEDDQRTRVVSLTPDGHQIFLEAVPLHQTAQRQVETTLGQEHFITLLGLLSKTCSAGRN